MSLEELSHAPDFQSRLADEFPQGAAVWQEGLSRRRFLQLMGASIALAGLNGCMRLPEQKIVPYTQQPEKLIPGRPLHFASTLQINGHPRGVVVTQNEGRPTHIAGNPLHPMSLGAADVWTTASVLDLYDPDRLQTVLHGANTSSWSTFTQEFIARKNQWLKDGGTGFCLLTPPLHSPTERRLLQEFLTRFPQARWFVYDPILAPGSTLPAPSEQLNLADADVIFSLESNFLYDRPDSLALIRAFSQRRQPDDGPNWNRLYVAESCPTITGVKADHRFAVAPQDFEQLATALLAGLQGTPAKDPRWPWLSALIEDLHQHAGRSLVLGGRVVSDQVHTTLRSINDLLGNTGKTLSLLRTLTAPIRGTLSDLVAHMRQGDVATLLMLGGNPVYDAPIDLTFSDLLAKVPTTIHHSFYANETSARSTWVVHATHDLETWGDAQAQDGTLSLVQPLIAPLYDGKSTAEILAFITDALDHSGYDLVRQTWQTGSSADPASFENLWHRWLRDGVMIPSPVIPISAASSSLSLASSLPEPAQSIPSQLWLSLRPSDAMWDGHHANNGWLQELPNPLTKLTWDNAVLLSPVLAAQLSIKDGDVIALHTQVARIDAPALIVPGHADQCLSISLGYGRTTCGNIGKEVGTNAYLLRRSNALWQVPLEKVELTSKTHSLARTQEHFRMEGRDLLHVSRIDTPLPASSPEAALPSLYPEVAYTGHKWALTLDLNACIGCNACILACQSENNIPVVGKEQVLMGREMQWIRVDRYYKGSAENPETHFQPVTCMQCEKAPCEVVCPVAATQHDDEGLNVMVYNRCVGTRYCSNNCPYKVRRFNFLFYNADIPESQRLRLNPNVTVRSRGVMEKCTYCVQRIEEARIGALREHRALRGEDIVTACQASCPAQAITFGDLSDPQSAVSQNRRKPGHYAMLADLDTQPRTTYLEKRINPNPAI